MITEKLTTGLNILFVGFNPSLTSHARGLNYAGRNNRFYRILADAGLTDELYPPEESVYFPERFGYGFTNIVARPTARADELTQAEYDQGRVILVKKLKKYKPAVACYVGKGVYQQFSKRKDVPWGMQSASTSVVKGVLDFVAPSSSGLVRMTLTEQVDIYRGLLPFVRNSRTAT